MRRYLLIVERNQPDLSDYLSRSCSGDDKVQVILDRRVGQRRQRGQTHDPERRLEERRRQPSNGDSFLSLGVTIIRLEPDGPRLQPPHPPKILVIDDEPGIREILTKMLESRGYQVVACADGQSALHRFQEEPFDLVVTDLNMPGLSGWEVAREVKLHAPRTPVILITGTVYQVDLVETRANGIDFVIWKPFEFREVMKTMAQALVGRFVATA
jgi:CheY-like chemotaxis protein